VAKKGGPVAAQALLVHKHILVLSPKGEQELLVEQVVKYLNEGSNGLDQDLILLLIELRLPQGRVERGEETACGLLKRCDRYLGSKLPTGSC